MGGYKRGGALCRFRSRSLRPALPAIVLANVRSLRNKADELFNMLSFNREFKDSSVRGFTKTWLDSTTPDEAVCPQSHSMFRVDRSYELTGKRRGGGVCFMVNKRRCHDSELTSTLCSRDLETITVDCRPFYSPREFASIVLMGVYIPPDAGAISAMKLVAARVTATESAHPDSVVIVFGVISSQPYQFKEVSTEL